MSGTVHYDGPVTRGQKRRALEALEETESAPTAGVVEEPMIPAPPRRIWISRRKSEYCGNQHPSVRTDCAGGLLCEGEEISKLWTDETGRTRVVGKYILGGDSYFYAERFHGQYKRLLQFVSRGSGGYESKYWVEDDPAISVLPAAPLKTPTARVVTRSQAQAQAAKFT